MKAINILDGDTFIKGSPIKAGVGSPILADNFGYDAASRLSSVTDQNNNSATYSYLVNSMLVSQITFKQNGTTRMTTAKQYDNLNRLTQISSAPSASYVSPLTYNYNYNPANQRTKDTLADGSYWVYGYDSLGQVTNACKYWSNGSPVAGQQFDYTFDTIGNRTQTQAGGDTNGLNLRVANYYANNLNQITNRDIPPYVDVIGASILTNSVTVNGLTAYRNQEYFREQVPANNTNSALWTNIIVAGGQNVTGNVYLAQEPEQFSYDADGNLTNDGRWSYTWDAENRLIQMALNTNIGPQYKLSFAYDPQGRRIQKVVSTNGVTIYTDNFLYDGWNLIATLSSSSALINSFMWGSDLSGSIQGAGGVGGLLEVSYYGTATTNCFPAYDGNGNVTALINAADGTLAADYEYGAFGEPIRITGTMGKNNPFRFSTKYDDDESDLLYFNLRYYSSSKASWISRDVIQEAGGNFLYGFVENDPVCNFDVLGMLSISYDSNGEGKWNITSHGITKSIGPAGGEEEFEFPINVLDLEPPGLLGGDGDGSRVWFLGGFEQKIKIKPSEETVSQCRPYDGEPIEFDGGHLSTHFYPLPVSISDEGSVKFGEAGELSLSVEESAGLAGFSISGSASSTYSQREWLKCRCWHIEQDSTFNFTFLDMNTAPGLVGVVALPTIYEGFKFAATAESEPAFEF